MVKKKGSKQTIVIIVLCILLLVTLVFGFTYSYYNGKSNLVTGTIITANLSLELQATKNGQTSQFLISALPSEEHLVCGNSLNNAKLNILNNSNEDTYVVVVCSFVNVLKLGTGEDITSQLNNVPALEFQEGAYNSNIWTALQYECKNVDKSYMCLIAKNVISKNTSSVEVIKENSVKIPSGWTNLLQNCNVTISVVAYAIQSSGLDESFYQNLENAKGNEAKTAEVIASQVLQTCLIDVNM